MLPGRCHMKPLFAAIALALAGLALGTGPATAQLQCSAGTLAFHAGGDLKGCRIDADHRFFTAQGDKIICKSGHRVDQHPSGAIESCTIAEPHMFAGVICRGPGRVRLNANGTLRRCG